MFLILYINHFAILKVLTSTSCPRLIKTRKGLFFRKERNRRRRFESREGAEAGVLLTSDKITKSKHVIAVMCDRARRFRPRFRRQSTFEKIVL